MDMEDVGIFVQERRRIGRANRQGCDARERRRINRPNSVDAAFTLRIVIAARDNGTPITRHRGNPFRELLYNRFDPAKVGKIGFVCLYYVHSRFVAARNQREPRSHRDFMLPECLAE